MASQEGIVTHTYRIINQSEIDFPSLIEHLSNHKSFPCNLHIRNHLLAQYGSLSQHPALIGKEVDEDPWKTYLEYRKGAVVVAIGDLPNQILTSGKQTNHQQDKDDQGLWALVIVYPSYAPGWKLLKEEEQNQSNGMWNAIRTTFWFSSEEPFQNNEIRKPDQIRKATKEESNLLQFIFQHHIPNAIRHAIRHSPTPNLIKWNSKKENKIVCDLHAVNHIWMKELQLIQEDIQNSFKVVRLNPCVTFTMSNQTSQELSNQINLDRWKVGSIGDEDEDEFEMVIKSNNITYPEYYLRSRRHLSVILYDTLQENGNEKGSKIMYPTKISYGSPAGWVYSHDDYSVGSLHVAEPYRRLMSKDGKQRIKVGTICLALMANRLIKSQQNALQWAGCQNSQDSQTFIISDAEQQKSIAVAFHKSVGFQPKTITSWGEFVIEL